MPSAERSRLRVLQLIDSLHVGGAERVVLHLAQQLDRAHFDVAVCCTKFIGILAGEATGAGVPVFDISAGKGWRRYTVPWRLRTLIRRLRPHVIHSHGTPALLAAGPAAVARQLPGWVHTFHYGNYPHLPPRTLKAERFFSRYVDRLVAVSESQRRAVAECHGLPPDRIQVVTNGVAPRPPRPSAAVLADRREVFGAGPETLLVGCVAVLTEQKGIPDLLSAAVSLRRAQPAMRFAVVGGGPLEADLRARAHALGLDDVVTFTGWRTDALDLLSSLDVFVMPSLWEAMPMVLLEAMAAGLPIVVSRVADNHLIVEDESSGLLVPPRSPEALERAVLRLATDPAKRAALGVAARARFEERFTVDRMVTAYEALYRAM